MTRMDAAGDRPFTSSDRTIVDFTYTSEQEDLRTMLVKFLTAKCAESDVRAAMETATGHDAGLWRALVDELGLTGLVVPESSGGAGLGLIELGIVAEELGASLACVPFFSTVVLATHALLFSGDTHIAPGLLADIVEGRITATVAVTEGRGEWNLNSIDCIADFTGDGCRLTGTKSFVVDGAQADVLLVVARIEDSLGLFAVQHDAAGLTRKPLSTMDQTRRFAAVELAATPAAVVTMDARAAVERLHDVAIAVLAAEQVGGAQRCLDMAVAYAKTRVQFGRPIGSFQAIKHKCADNLIRLEAARAGMGYALWSADAEDAHDFALSASVAKAASSEAFFEAAADNIQIHGGIGFTWEHPAHLYFKRAKTSELWFGDAIRQRDRIGRLLHLI